MFLLMLPIKLNRSSRGIAAIDPQCGFSVWIPLCGFSPCGLHTPKQTVKQFFRRPKITSCKSTKVKCQWFFFSISSDRLRIAQTVLRYTWACERRAPLNWPKISVTVTERHIVLDIVSESHRLNEALLLFDYRLLSLWLAVDFGPLLTSRTVKMQRADSVAHTVHWPPNGLMWI